MPTWRGIPGVAAFDNKLYVTGGVDDGFQLMSTVDCYDPDTNTWSQMKNMNSTRYGHCLVSLHRRLYAIGGYRYILNGGLFGRSSDNIHDTVEVYDPDSNTWTVLKQKLDGKVSDTEVGIIKKCYLKPASKRRFFKNCKVM